MENEKKVEVVFTCLDFSIPPEDVLSDVFSMLLKKQDIPAFLSDHIMNFQIKERV